MKASIEWLRAFVPFTQSPREIAELLTARVATVEGLERLREDLASIVVGRVIEAGRHPDSDHLWVTRVDAGGPEALDVVCGAPNVEAGRLYPFAPSGTTMPSGMKIERRKIRGAVSNGMLCSARELGLGDEHEGIMALDIEAPPGTPFLEAVPVGDTRLIVDVLPNRPDLLSHLGLAREVSAATGIPLSFPVELRKHETEFVRASCSETEGRAGPIHVRVDDRDGAPRYMGVYIGGITVAPSPAWLVERLRAVGARSVNNVVDVTNYMLHGLGQPMHAFDARKIAGGAVIVRKARAGERLVTLDGVDRVLDESMTVIADGERAIGVAGVLGGRDTEVGETTSDVFLEVARFAPAALRRTRRALGVSSDASYRFERGIDPELQPLALYEAASLIIGLAGGSVIGPPVDVCTPSVSARSISVRPSRISQLLGVPMSADRIASLLGPIGLSSTTAADGAMDVCVPSWRNDLELEADVAEEVARLHGYDSLPDDLRPYRPSSIPTNSLVELTDRLRVLLAGSGLLEARPMPFVAGDAATHVTVANPLAENEGRLRHSVLESLTARAEYNLARAVRAVRLFEVGAVFLPSPGRLPQEEMRVGAILLGPRRPAHFSEPTPPHFDEWDAKALAEQIATSIDPRAVVTSSHEAGALFDIVVHGASAGTVREMVLDAPSGSPRAYGVEIRMAVVPSDNERPAGRERYLPALGRWQPFRSLPTTPAMERDLNLLVPDRISAEAVVIAITGASGELLERTVLRSEYRGAGVPDGHRSLTYGLVFRHPDRTLRDKEIDGRVAKLLRTLEEALDVRQRS